VCTPERCGLILSDNILSETEKNVLIEMAKNVLAVGGQGDEPIHLNLHTGHMRNKTADINLFNTEYGKRIFKNTYLNVYRCVLFQLTRSPGFLNNLVFQYLPVASLDFYDKRKPFKLYFSQLKWAKSMKAVLLSKNPEKLMIYPC